MWRRAKRFGRHAGAGHQPCGDGVRVPHLARPEVVASPDRRGHGVGQVEESASNLRIAGEPACPADRLAEIRDQPVRPAAHLVAEQARPPEVSATDCSGRDHPAARPEAVRRRRELDRVANTAELDDQRGVIEIAPGTVLVSGCDRLEDPAVETDGVATRAKRDPVQIHGCCRRGVHRCHSASPAARRSASGVSHGVSADVPQSGRGPVRRRAIACAGFARRRERRLRFGSTSAARQPRSARRRGAQRR